MSARRAPLLGAALAVAASSLVLVAPAAHSASCVTYDLSENHRAVVVHNTCSETRRVKVIWNNATDSACQQMAAYNGEFIDSRGWPAAFDRLAAC